MVLTTMDNLFLGLIFKVLGVSMKSLVTKVRNSHCVAKSRQKKKMHWNLKLKKRRVSTCPEYFIWIAYPDHRQPGASYFAFYRNHGKIHAHISGDKQMPVPGVKGFMSIWIDFVKMKKKIYQFITGT